MYNSNPNLDNYNEYDNGNFSLNTTLKTISLNSLEDPNHIRNYEYIIEENYFTLRETQVIAGDNYYYIYKYQKTINKNGLICSMTETYDPYANAVAERINGIIKLEFINGNYFSDISTMKILIKDSIRVYNEKRPHYSCYYKTPNEMPQQKKIKIRTYKSKTANKNVFVGC